MRARPPDGIRDGSVKRVRSVKRVTPEQIKSARDTVVGSAAAVADSRAVDAIRSAGGTVVEGATESASRAADAGRGAATQSRTLAREGLSSTREKVLWDSVLPEEARNNLLSAVKSSRVLSAGAKRNITTQVAPALGELFDTEVDCQAQIPSILQGLLASSEGSALVNSWLQEMMSGRPTIYDRAIDAAYNATRIGGGDHRLFDGGHSLVGGLQVVREASPDDSILEGGRTPAVAREGCHDSQGSSPCHLGAGHLQWLD